MENTNNSVEDSQKITTPEVLKVENNKEQQELSPEQKLSNVEEMILKQENEISKLTETLKETKTDLDKLREELGLPKGEEDPPSILQGKDKIKQLTDYQKELMEQKENILKDKVKSEANKKEQGEKKEKISEGLLSQLSESINKKSELEIKVGELKQSPEVQQLERETLELTEKKKTLEGLKNADNNNSTNISGSFSSTGNSSISFESSVVSKSEVGENKEEEINLEQEAENLLEKTKVSILNLEKEEIIYSPEGLNIQLEEIEIEAKKVQAEIDIWSTGNMNQKIFNESLQKINNPEEAQDFENKELFLKFRDIDSEMNNSKNKNNEYHQNIDSKQKEIDDREKNIKDLKIPHEGKILEIINSKEKPEENKENSETKEAINTAEDKKEDTGTNNELEKTEETIKDTNNNESPIK